jgi:hydrogenase maturation protease
MILRTLVAGFGNVRLGDDGFGVEVVHRLKAQPLPEGAHVRDFGIRGLHLVFDLLESWDAILLVDAMKHGDPPGTVFVLDPNIDAIGDPSSLPDAQSLHPAAVLRTAHALGARMYNLHVIGCEPADLSEHVGLSEPVEHGVDEAVRIVHERLAEGARPFA